MREASTEAPAALGHLKVLDLSRILAGPWATQILADLGAEVTKVENPRGGDDTRHWGPSVGGKAGQEMADAAYFTTCNRNKQSVTIDFSTPEGVELVRRLARDSDVVVENYKLGGLAKYGLDYDSLREINPDIIYCSVTGFGQDGPYAHRAGYDFLIQAMGGLMSITGQPDGAPGAEPVKVGVAVSDLFTGMYAAVAILAAVTHRERTGKGQHIDCALLDSQVAMLANQGANWLVSGVVPTRMGNSHPNVVPYSVYQAEDGHLVINCGNDGQFARLCDTLGLDGVAADPRFRTNGDRITNRDALEQLLRDRVSRRQRDEIIAALEAVNVPCGPINTIPDVFADPHIRARGLEIDLKRADGTEVPTVAFPPRLSATPASYRHAPPALGADTDAVLSARLGLDDEAIAALRDKGVI